jgi:hypothetical protein
VTKRLNGVLAAALVALGATVLSTTTPVTMSAHTSSGLALSRDGRQWSSDLDSPLFEKDLRFVPGETRVETFRVRNSSADKAELRVRLLAQDPSDWLGADGFRMRVRLDDRRWVLVRGDGDQPDNHMVLDPGESVPVSVRVRLRRAAGNRNMARRLSFTIVVRLTELTSAATRTEASS